MLHRHALGQFPAKPHTTLYENGRLLMEQMITREGFHGPYSVLYFRVPPMEECSVETFALPGYCPVEVLAEQPLRRRHVKTQDMKPQGDYLTGRRTLMVSASLDLGVMKPAANTHRYFCNGDGDELFFVKEGGGTLESVFGLLPFGRHDYVLVPKGTFYRLRIDGPSATILTFEGRPEIKIPNAYRNAWGQLLDEAPFTHRDFKLPMELARYSAAEHGKPPFEVVMKRSGRLTLHKFEHWPLEVVGWDGAVYPVVFNIHDYQPKTGLVHLPPTTHTTFAGDRFVICSFVPRVVDYHPQAIPCPYAHASVDMDEILYYVEGNFTSRRGIDSESISLHPAGVTHGPHPGTYEKSIGHQRTSELAVMADCYDAWKLTTEAVKLEERDYHMTWIDRKSDGGAWRPE